MNKCQICLFLHHNVLFVLITGYHAIWIFQSHFVDSNAALHCTKKSPPYVSMVKPISPFINSLDLKLIPLGKIIVTNDSKKLPLAETELDIK